MVKVKWKKALAAAVAAAMTLMAVPSMVFADEAEVLPEEVIVYEADEAEQIDNEVFEDQTDSEEIVVEEPDMFSDEQETVEIVSDSEEENVGAGPVAASWSSPKSYTIEKEEKGAIYPSSYESDDEKADKYYEWAFYKFDVKKTGYYKLTASAESEIGFIVTSSETFIPYRASASWKNSKVTFQSEGATKHDKTMGLVDGQSLWLIVDGRYSDKSLDVINYTFSLKFTQEVKLSDKRKPDSISIDNKAQIGKTNPEFKGHMGLDIDDDDKDLSESESIRDLLEGIVFGNTSALSSIFNWLLLLSLIKNPLPLFKSYNNINLLYLQHMNT